MLLNDTKIICFPGKKGFSFSLIFSSCEKCFFLRISFLLETFSFKKTGGTMSTRVINIFSNISPAVKWPGWLPCLYQLARGPNQSVRVSHLADFRNNILIISNQQTTTKAEQGRTRQDMSLEQTSLNFVTLTVSGTLLQWFK